MFLPLPHADMHQFDDFTDIHDIIFAMIESVTVQWDIPVCSLTAA